MTTTAVKSGEHFGKKAGDKIVKMLSKSGDSKKPKKVTFKDDESVKPVRKKMTDQEIHQKVNQIMSGGKIRNRKII